MNNCFDYSFIKCGTPASGEVTLDAVFNTLSKLDLYGMFDDPQGAIDRATELAYSSMTTALVSKEGRINNTYNKVLGERFIDTFSNIGNYEFFSKEKQYVRLNKAYVNVNFTGTINLKLVNELAVVELVPVSVVSGVTSTVTLDKDFKYVKVSVNEDVEGRTTYACGISGVLVDYSILCDYHAFICANKEMFQTCMNYKVASILLTDGVFSGEIGQRLMQNEDYQKLKDEYEIQYERELDNLSIKESGCFNCGSRIQPVSWIR